MSGAELIRAAGPVFWVLLALSVYTLYLVLADLLRRKAAALLPRKGNTEWTLDRLGDLAQFAPLLGLFGTSLGMIRAFLALGQGGNPELLAQGIAEALTNTGMGLFVAVVAYGGRVLLSALPSGDEGGVEGGEK
jgi:biopolymer transport protein ExbB